MTLSRRSFLGGVLTLAAVTVAARYQFAKPRIWADGTHDDAPGLNAMFAGEDFLTDVPDLIRNGDWESIVGLRGGAFMLGSKLILGNPTKSFSIHSCRFTALDIFGDGEMLQIREGVRDSSIVDCHFDGSNIVNRGILYERISRLDFTKPENASAFMLTYEG
jgi:hypothetical protein